MPKQSLKVPELKLSTSLGLRPLTLKPKRLLVLTGSSGAGKSSLACSLAGRLLRDGISCDFYESSSLLRQEEKLTSWPEVSPAKISHGYKNILRQSETDVSILIGAPRTASQCALFLRRMRFVEKSTSGVVSLHGILFLDARETVLIANMQDQDPERPDFNFQTHRYQQGLLHLPQVKKTLEQSAFSDRFLYLDTSDFSADDYQQIVDRFSVQIAASLKDHSFISEVE